VPRDPDGAGPLTGPAQGDLYKSQSARASCGSCHDDVVWGQNYAANTQIMGAQANDSNCLLCHAPSGDPLAVEDAHRHPLYDETFNPGLNVDVSAVAEAGTNNGDGTIDVGEKIAVTLSITDDTGSAVSPSVNGITSYSVVVSGPTSNSNLLLSGSIPSPRSPVRSRTRSTCRRSKCSSTSATPSAEWVRRSQPASHLTGT
jgi:hypothetical protein